MDNQMTARTAAEIDWTALKGIRPATGSGNGKAKFSDSEARRIREFWQREKIPMAWLTRHFGFSDIQVIRRVCYDQNKRQVKGAVK